VTLERFQLEAPVVVSCMIHGVIGGRWHWAMAPALGRPVRVCDRCSPPDDGSATLPPQ
jgi:hypothetical protein